MDAVFELLDAASVLVGEGLTTRDIGSVLGLPQQRISQIIPEPAPDRARPGRHGENRSGRKSASMSSHVPVTISEASNRPITGPSVIPLCETAS